MRSPRNTFSQYNRMKFWIMRSQSNISVYAVKYMLSLRARLASHLALSGFYKNGDHYNACVPRQDDQAGLQGKFYTTRVTEFCS